MDGVFTAVTNFLPHKSVPQSGVVHNLEQGNPLVDRRIQHDSTTSLYARFCLSPSGTLGGSSSNPLLVLLKGYSFVLVTVGASQVSDN